ncbi:MAG TPA: response regulator [Phycisphaerae bacterium]|nr:response regulator [Phycisphaerae bacterium]HQL76201.1 response regulator [Phycisphaerae bacterium]
MDTRMRITVLIADDNREVRDFLAFFLGREADLEVVGQAADGAEALSLIQTLKPDVVLMDVEMPNVNGVEATLQAASLPCPPQIIGMSVLDHADTMQAAGACAFMYKDGLFRNAKRLIRRHARRVDRRE